MILNNYKKFYENIDRENIYATGSDLKVDVFYEQLTVNFIKRFLLKDKKILEIGSSKGAYQNVVLDYTGIDIVESLRKNYVKPYFVNELGQPYPFSNECFDGVFTRAVFEHIPNIDFILKEMLRVLKKDGYIFFHMAWNARSWAAGGYLVRPYSDFNWNGKLIKALLPLRENIFIRSFYIFFKRGGLIIRFILNKNNFKIHLKYKKIKPNYEIFWHSDFDACNSVDSFALMLYFKANNCKIFNYSNLLRAFFVRSGNLIIQKL